MSRVFLVVLFSELSSGDRWHGPCDLPDRLRFLFTSEAGGWEIVMADRTGISQRRQIADIIGALLAKRGGATLVAVDQNLAEAGLTSLDMVNLMLAIEDEFEIEIPQRQMTPANFRSVAAIEALVSSVAMAA
jgi:acyl carrier protein